MATLESLRVLFEGDASSIQRAAAQGSGAVGNFAKTANAEGAAAGAGFRSGSMMMVAASGAVVAGLAFAVHKAAEYSESIRTLSKTTGASAQDASKLAFVMQHLGMSVETASKPLVLFSRNMVNGTTNFARWYTSAQVAKMRTEGLIPALETAAKRYQSLGTAQERNAFLMDNFGRSGVQMRRLLELSTADFSKLSAEASRFGLVLTQSNIEAFHSFTESTHDAGLAVKGLIVQLGSDVVPVFDALVKGVTAAVTALNMIPAPIRQTAVVGLLMLAMFNLTSTAVVFLVGKLQAGAAALLNFSAGMGSATLGAESLAVAEGEATTGALTLDGALSPITAVLAVVAAQLYLGSRAAASWAKSVEGAGTTARRLTRINEELNKSTVSQINDAAQAKSWWEKGAQAAGLYGITVVKVALAHRDLGKEQARLAEQQRVLNSLQGQGADVSEADAKSLGEMATALGSTANNALVMDLATTRLRTSLQGVDINSTAGTAAMAQYALALQSTGLDANKAADAARKAGEEIEKAAQKEIQSTIDLSASFDSFAKKAKGSLDEFVTATQANTADIAKWHDNLNAIFAAGAPALAAQLLKLGPEGAKAAAQAAAQIGGPGGLGKLEAIAGNAVTQAKLHGLDPALEAWQPNMAGKGAEATNALATAVGVGLGKIAPLFNANLKNIEPVVTQGFYNAVVAPITAAGGQVVQVVQDKNNEMVTAWVSAAGQIAVQVNDVTGNMKSINTVNYNPAKVSVAQLAAALHIPIPAAQALIERLRDLDRTDPHSTITVDASQAMATIAEVNRSLAGIDRYIPVEVHTAYTSSGDALSSRVPGTHAGALIMHAGGLVGGATVAHSGIRLLSDERLIKAQVGERVLSKAQNRAYMQRPSASTASLRAPGGGGGGGQVFHFHGTVFDERRVKEWILETLRREGFRNNDLGL